MKSDVQIIGGEMIVSGVSYISFYTVESKSKAPLTKDTIGAICMRYSLDVWFIGSIFS